MSVGRRRAAAVLGVVAVLSVPVALAAGGFNGASLVGVLSAVALIALPLLPSRAPASR